MSAFTSPSHAGVLFHPTDGPDAADVEATWHVLTSLEKERALRFHFERDRHRWVRGRAWIRQELGKALGQSAESVVITAEPGGRLYLPEHPGVDSRYLSGRPHRRGHRNRRPHLSCHGNRRRIFPAGRTRMDRPRHCRPLFPSLDRQGSPHESHRTRHVPPA